VTVIGLMLRVLVELQTDSQSEASKEVLRSHLHGELASPRLASFDAPPLWDLRSKCDVAGTLIEILEEDGKSPQRVQEMMSSISVLDQYWRKFPDARIPLALQRYGLDSIRPSEVRQEAVQRRALMAGSDTPSFYAEILKGYPDLAGPIESALRAFIEGHPQWMPIQELYTAEVRDALRTYVDGRMRVESFPEGRKMYQSLIPALDRMVGSSPEKGGEAPHSGNPDPKSTFGTKASDQGSSSNRSPKAIPLDSGTHSLGRIGATAALGVGLAAIVVLFRVLRRK